MAHISKYSSILLGLQYGIYELFHDHLKVKV